MSTKILDCTLRDGGYYGNWDFNRSTVNKYLAALNYGISKANGDLVVRMEILHYSKVSNISICLKAPQFS